MITIDDLKTRAGLLLYRQLPEEYRYLDSQGRQDNELGDLEAYLHGFGHLLDLIRGTAEQAYADAFAEEADNERLIQTWLLPYLAELVGAELLAPDPGKRVEELNNAVVWFKSKGTLSNLDSVSDVVSGAETVQIEGWRRILTTPRLSLPPFTAAAAAMGDGDPLGPPTLPLGTPDVRHSNRAIVDPAGANPLYRLSTPQRDGEGRLLDDPLVVHWQPRALRGTPCFPNAYDDTAVRTPDLRNPERSDVGPHPRRTIVHIRPPQGFFEPGLKEVALPGGKNPLGFAIGSSRTQHYGPHEVLEQLGQPLDPAPDKIVISGDLTITTDLDVAFEDLLFLGRITIAAGSSTKLSLTRCAVAELDINTAADKPQVEAQDCLIGEIQGAGSFAQLVYCTVMGETRLSRLWASDCLFTGDLIGLDCSDDASCIRYSRVSDPDGLAGCLPAKSPVNTGDDPNFIRLFFGVEDDCVLRPAEFGESGCAVLDLTTSKAIGEGAEDEGEMGAYHHLYHFAQLRALRLKLRDFLPLGQEISLRYDPHLSRLPATAQ